MRRVGGRSVMAVGGAIALVVSATVAIPAGATDGINCHDQNPYPDGTPRLAFTRPLPIPTVLADANIIVRMKNAPVQALPCGNATTMWTYTGLYMLHCHILNHEDHDMMAQFNVVEPPS